MSCDQNWGRSSRGPHRQGWLRHAYVWFTNCDSLTVFCFSIESPFGDDRGDWHTLPITRLSSSWDTAKFTGLEWAIRFCVPSEGGVQVDLRGEGFGHVSGGISTSFDVECGALQSNPTTWVHLLRSSDYRRSDEIRWSNDETVSANRWRECRGTSQEQKWLFHRWYGKIPWPCQTDID